MKKISEKQLTNHVNLVKWEQTKTTQKFNLLTVHSLLLNSNSKFIQLKQKVQVFNSSIQKGIDRKHLQYQYIKKLYEMLRQMVMISNYQNQQQFLSNVYEWSKQGVRQDFQFDQLSQNSKSRPTTATTKVRPFSAYSRPKSGVPRMNLIKLDDPIQIKIQNKTKQNVDYEKLKPGDIQFYTGNRTLHQKQQKPKKKLKQYQRKIFYQEEPDSDLQIIELKQQKPVQFFKPEVKIQEPDQQLPVQQGKENPVGEDDNNALGGQEQGPLEIQEDVNIDDLPMQGQALQQQKEVIDKLKPKLKSFVNYQTELSKKSMNYAKGINQYYQNRNNVVRKNVEDRIIQQKMCDWAKQKSRTKRQQRRRAESARIATKKIGIGYKDNVETQAQNVNFINFQNIIVPQTKQSRPLTAFRAFNETNRKQLIKNCFITGNIKTIQRPLNSTIERFQRIVSLAQKPKKKTFEQILRDAQQKVKQQELQQIITVKQRFAKHKVPFQANRIAKSVTCHGLGAQQNQYDQEGFAGDITGMNMMKNPFFKVGKKKKKKKKKK